MAPDPYWKHVTKLSTYEGSTGSKKWECNYCGLEKTGSVIRVKDHLACVPNKDINICQNVPADVCARLDAWRRQRLGISVHEGERSHDVEGDVSLCEGSQVGASKRSAFALCQP